MSIKADFVLTGNGKQNNKKFTIGAGTSVTCHFKDSGLDTENDKYYDLRYDGAKQVSIITNNKAAAITHINGQELDYPVTIPTGGYYRTQGIDWISITILSNQAATTFEVWGN